MKILSQNVKKGIVTVKIENPDDLWHLKTIIDEGDRVKGKTYRKIKLGQEDSKQIVVKKPVTITIIVDKIEFSKFSQELRVLGKVEQGPEDVPSGSHHSFSLEEGSMITILKTKWYAYQLDRINEAQKKFDEILIAVHDREHVIFALLNPQGIHMLAEIKGDVQKKFVESSSGSFYHQISNQLQQYFDKYNQPRTIVASPAFFKEEVFKELSDEVKKSVTLASVSQVSKEVFDELLKRPELQDVLKQDRLSKEAIVVEEVLKEMSMQGLVAYGTESIRVSVQAGAVKTLIITDNTITQARENDTFDEIEKLFKTVEQMKGKVFIIHGDTDSGKQIEGIGGMAALLRYKMG